MKNGTIALAAVAVALGAVLAWMDRSAKQAEDERSAEAHAAERVELRGGKVVRRPAMQADDDFVEGVELPAGARLLDALQVVHACPRLQWIDVRKAALTPAEVERLQAEAPRLRIDR